MLMLDGTLRVAVKHGRRGAFRVGTLMTSIGNFKVLDKALEQFEAGDYAGNFLVESIYLKCEVWQGGMYNNIRADIAKGGFLIQDEQASPEHGEELAPDPLDEEKPDFKAQAPAEAGNNPENAQASPLSNPSSDASLKQADEELFGLEIYQRFIQCMDIALDPTVDREQFRLQRDRLKADGYRFHSQTQLWKKASAE